MPNHEQRPETLTVKEYAQRQRCHPATIYRWLLAGKIPGAEKGPGGWRIPVAGEQRE